MLPDTIDVEARGGSHPDSQIDSVKKQIVEQVFIHDLLDVFVWGKAE